MATNRIKPHILINGHAESFTYRYPGNFPVSKEPKAQNRAIHGNKLLQQLQSVGNQIDLNNNNELAYGLVRDDTIYVDFVSEWGFELKFESLDQDKYDPDFQILNIREEKRTVGVDSEESRYHATLVMTKGGIGQFVKKVEKYITENGRTRGEDNGKPKNYALVNNIHNIQLATLKSFWTDEPEIPFPEVGESIWWEVWFRRNRDDENINRVLQNLSAVEVQIGQSELLFAEHRVRLVKGTAAQLARSLLLLDSLAELRKPQEIADFLSHKDDSNSAAGHTEWLEDLGQRTQATFNENSVLVCLLDSGVNNEHPLLKPFLPDAHLYTYNEAWGTYDGWENGGHGTGVAGLALYGDLTDALADPAQIRIAHGLESFKIVQLSDPNDVELYGAVTEYACSVPLIDRAHAPRVFCMTITDKTQAFKGRPSAWSAAVDKIAFGSSMDPIDPQLIIVSGGNAVINNLDEHPTVNYIESIHDPGQAYNCLTVGAYTRKDKIDQSQWPGWRALALHGAMAPCNSTSIIWEHQWPIKPDIVMEGGNLSTNEHFVVSHPSLKVLTTDKDYPSAIFLPFGDTSGAAALAAKMAAELRTAYPQYWPETIRALMVHSAEWTSAMLNGQPFENLTERARINLLRSVGYGVPIREKAMYSAENSLTLIAEREIQPYQQQGSTIKYNEYHLFALPWPADILADELYAEDVILKITLSYFIEPNPGSKNKKYASNFQYHSHGLDFAVIKPGEALRTFKQRISAASESPEDDIDTRDEQWLIKRVRSRGSVKKDFIVMSGADMARRNTIAIYPKNGWYKNRKKLGKANSKVRYSLIVTLETPTIDVDIYTPVQIKIENIIPS